MRGSADCLTLAADWVLVRRGVDPLAGLRGYTDAEANDLLAGVWGGFVRRCGRGARAAGLEMTTAPVPGDVGVIVVAGLAHTAIRTERGWVTRIESGLLSVPAERVRVLAAWKV